MTMPFKSLAIHGLRGFAYEQTIEFAVPNGEPGSGLTILVGPNNGGKTTVIEALWLMSIEKPEAIPEEYRNTVALQKVAITVRDGDDQVAHLRTVDDSGGHLVRSGSSGFEPYRRMFVLPSKRSFDHRFQISGVGSRDAYMEYFRS